jgi:hypothetical protein
MARHLIRALGGIALASACLALAACSSGSATVGKVGKADSVPVNGGKVTITEGGKVLCVATVVNGKATCQVPASTIGLGIHSIVGQYAGPGNKPATSKPVSVEVTKASTTSVLSISPVKLTYGNEQAARVTVRVIPAHAGTPTGTVLVGAGSTVVCKVTLSGGAGSCTMSAQRLKAGSWTLYATYPGDGLHNASTSAPVKITVAS